MSYTVKCDRCGDTAKTPAPFGEAPVGWLALSEVRPHGQVTSEDRGYHFCAECVSSFEDWLKQQKPDPAPVQVAADPFVTAQRWFEEEKSKLLMQTVKGETIFVDGQPLRDPKFISEAPPWQTGDQWRMYVTFSTLCEEPGWVKEDA